MSKFKVTMVVNWEMGDASNVKDQLKDFVTRGFGDSVCWIDIQPVVENCHHCQKPLDDGKNHGWGGCHAY